MKSSTSKKNIDYQEEESVNGTFERYVDPNVCLSMYYIWFDSCEFVEIGIEVFS
jgi:hypothetical protein